MLDKRVVALVLSMIGVCLNKPMGYEYPTPKVPFIEGPTMSTTSLPTPDSLDCVPPDLDDINYQNLLNLGIPLCPPDESYDDYDPNDIPLDQAAPSDDLPGYEYPVPENPLTLPSKTTSTTTPLSLPECVPSDEQTIGSNPDFLQSGVPLCPEEYDEEYDDYDPNDIPADQAMPQPDCVPADQKDTGMNPEYLNAGVPLCPSDEPAGYEYPVPDNPLTLPPRTTTTTAAPEIYDDYDPNDVPDDQAEPKGYEYPVPEIPFTLPTKLTTPVVTTTQLIQPECVPEEQKNDGENPQFLALGVPICPSDDLPAYQPLPSYDDYDPSDIPADQAESLPGGYSYPIPSNPLQLPERNRKAKLVLEDDPDLLLIGLTHHEDDSYDPEYYDHNSPDYVDSMDNDDDDSEGEDVRSLAVTESGISFTGNGRVFSFHVPSSFNALPKLPKTSSKSIDNLNVIIDGTLLPPTLDAGRRKVPIDTEVVRKNKNKFKEANSQAIKLSRMPKMVNDNKEARKVARTTTGPNKTRTSKLDKILESENEKSRKISVQAWLRRG